jgi:hypothetical protein
LQSASAVQPQVPVPAQAPAVQADCQVLRWERALLAHRDHVIARLDADEEAAA